MMKRSWACRSGSIAMSRDDDTFSIFWANLDNIYIYITGKLENSGV